MAIRNRNSLIKKWCIRYLFFVMIAVVGIAGILIYFKNDYERLAMQTLIARLDVTAEFYNRTLEAELPMIYIATEIRELTKAQFYSATLYNMSGEIIFSRYRDKNHPEDDFIYNGEGQIFTSLNNERVICVDRKLFRGDMWVGTLRFSSSLRILDFKYQEFVFNICILAVVGISILVFISYIFMRSMVRPLIKMKNVAEIYAKGNFDVDMDISRSDEIGQLAETMQIMAKELKYLDDGKYQFIDTISHELRTPMTSILGWCDLMEMRPELSDKGINMIKIETQRLGDLVSNMMAFNGFNTKQELKLSEFDLIELVEEVLLIFKPRMERYQIEAYKLMESESLRVVTDRGKLKQVIVNIVDNALKFSDQGTRLEIGQFVEGEGFALWVKDQGRGIEKEHLDQLSQKYFRGGSDKPGMGLGLAIVKDLLNLMNGEMTVESQVGIGTKMMMHFKPLQIENTEQVIQL